MKRDKDARLNSKMSPQPGKKPLTRGDDGWICEHVCIDGLMLTLEDGLKGGADNGEPQQVHQAIVNGTTDLDVKTLTIPETVEYEGMTFPVRRIGIVAFQDCHRLRRIHFPSTLQAIDMEAFFGCYYLDNIVLPDGFKRLAYAAFGDCCRLKQISVKNLANINVAERVFAGCNENLIIINRDEEDAE